MKWAEPYPRVAGKNQEEYLSSEALLEKCSIFTDGETDGEIEVMELVSIILGGSRTASVTLSPAMAASCQPPTSPLSPG